MSLRDTHLAVTRSCRLLWKYLFAHAYTYVCRRVPAIGFQSTVLWVVCVVVLLRLGFILLFCGGLENGCFEGFYR